jgi:hypothetical protein
MDWSTMEQKSWGFEGSLLITRPRHDFGASNDLVALSAKFVRLKYYSMGNSSSAPSNATGADGLAGLQTLSIRKSAYIASFIAICILHLIKWIYLAR